MVAIRTELDDMRDLAREHVFTYVQVEENFDQFFFARLVVDALGQQLPAIIAQGSIVPESDGENHVGSPSKSVVYKCQKR